MHRSKKGVSEVVASILIILITILAVTLVAGVIVPMVKNWMSQSKECFEARDKISIELGKFTYYNETDTIIMLKRAGSEFDISGILISLRLEDGSSRAYKIVNDANIEGVRMYNGSPVLELPGMGEARTYIFSVSSDFVQIAPILPSEKICETISENLEMR